MTSRHGVPLRGLDAGRSTLFQGKFGRMFRSLPPAHYGKKEEEELKHLLHLGTRMESSFDVPKDGFDGEESGIPALYTYFGQFIDHDITFDPASSLQKQDDPDALVDYRTPAFDLDNVYGRGPDDQPYLYNKKSFILGDTINGGLKPAVDLQRNLLGRALIGDPRNDENAIVSQLQALFLRFHNRMVVENSDASFEEVQQLVRFHYQYLVLHDFLPRIVQDSVLDELKVDGHYAREKLKFYHWHDAPFMPVEFSVAAYRLGHSMVRPGYRLNDNTLLPIFPIEKHGFREGLTGFRKMSPDWGIDWGRLIDIDTRAYDGDKATREKRLQFAYRIDTALVNPLAHLPKVVASDKPPSLAARNLQRAFRLGLPSGQSVARAMGLEPLKNEKIIIGQALDKPDGPLHNIMSISEVFTDNCPLWTYILAEAMHKPQSVSLPVKERKSVTTPRLGAVGGRIVAEVFLGMMFGDNHSLLSLDPTWTPKSGTSYALKDFVKTALS